MDHMLIATLANNLERGGTIDIIFLNDMFKIFIYFLNMIVNVNKLYGKYK